MRGFFVFIPLYYKAVIFCLPTVHSYQHRLRRTRQPHIFNQLFFAAIAAAVKTSVARMLHIAVLLVSKKIHCNFKPCAKSCLHT
jgi:hypothetical protein